MAMMTLITFHCWRNNAVALSKDWTWSFTQGWFLKAFGKDLHLRSTHLKYIFCKFLSEIENSRVISFRHCRKLYWFSLYTSKWNEKRNNNSVTIATRRWAYTKNVSANTHIFNTVIISFLNLDQFIRLLIRATNGCTVPRIVLYRLFLFYVSAASKKIFRKVSSTGLGWYCYVQYIYCYFCSTSCIRPR